MDPTVRPVPTQRAWAWRKKWNYLDVQEGLLARQRDDTLTFALGWRGEGAELFRFPLSRTTIRRLGGLYMGATMEVSCDGARFFVTFINPAMHTIRPKLTARQGRELVQGWVALATRLSAEMLGDAGRPVDANSLPADAAEHPVPAATAELGRSTPNDPVLMPQAAQAQRDQAEADRLLSGLLSGKAELALRDMILTLHREGASTEIGVMLAWIRAHHPPEALAILANMLRRADLGPYADALAATTTVTWSPVQGHGQVP